MGNALIFQVRLQFSFEFVTQISVQHARLFANALQHTLYLSRSRRSHRFRPSATCKDINNAKKIPTTKGEHGSRIGLPYLIGRRGMDAAPRQVLRVRKDLFPGAELEHFIRESF